jgi:hypothetical protein
VITLRGNEEHARTYSFKVQGTIKVHLLVLWLLRWWGLLGFCPFRDEIHEDLRLDGLLRSKLEVEIQARPTT